MDCHAEEAQVVLPIITRSTMRIWRALKCVDVPVTRANGSEATESKHLYGLTLVPWQRDRTLIRDVTVVGTPVKLVHTVNVLYTM